MSLASYISDRGDHNRSADNAYDDIASLCIRGKAWTREKETEMKEEEKKKRKKKKRKKKNKNKCNNNNKNETT